jgi:membrane associated rhomboid family serine protease
MLTVALLLLLFPADGLITMGQGKRGGAPKSNGQGFGSKRPPLVLPSVRTRLPDDPESVPCAYCTAAVLHSPSAPRAAERPSIVRAARAVRFGAVRMDGKRPGDDAFDGADAELVRRRDLERQFAEFKTGERRLRSKIFLLPGVRSLYLLGSSLRSSSRRQLSFLQSAASAIPASQQLLVLNVIVFILQSSLMPTLLLAGARINRLILYSGQLHRLATPMFLHGDVRHLLFNSLSLSNIGPAVEGIFGTKRFLLIYFFSGIFGNMVGVEYGGRAPSVGASGAIFGLLGAMLVYCRRAQEQRINVGPSLMRSLLFSVIFGMIPHGRVDQWAHLGGLLGGLFVAVVYAPWRWGKARAQGSGRGYVIEPSNSRPLMPEQGADISLFAVSMSVLLACGYGLDLAFRLKEANGWQRAGGAALRRVLEQPPRLPGLWRFF